MYMGKSFQSRKCGLDFSACIILSHIVKWKFVVGEFKLGLHRGGKSGLFIKYLHSVGFKIQASDWAIDKSKAVVDT